MNRYHLLAAGGVALAATVVVLKPVVALYAAITAVALVAVGAFALWCLNRYLFSGAELAEQRDVQPLPPAQQAAAPSPRILRRPPPLDLRGLSVREDASPLSSAEVFMTPSSRSAQNSPRSPASGAEEFGTPRGVAEPVAIPDVNSPRPVIVLQQISLKECVRQLFTLDQEMMAGGFYSVQTYFQRIDAIIRSLQDADPYTIKERLVHLQQTDLEAAPWIDKIRRTGMIRHFPRPPLLSLPQAVAFGIGLPAPLSFQALHKHVNRLENHNLHFLYREGRQLYKTDAQFRANADRLLERQDLVALLQDLIDHFVAVTGVSQADACAFMGRKDYVGFAKHFLNAKSAVERLQPLTQEQAALDRNVAALVEFFATTWSASFMRPKTWETLDEKFRSFGYISEEDFLQSLQYLYQNDPATKKHIDGLLEPSMFLNPDSYTKHKTVLTFLNKGLDIAMIFGGISQEEYFTLCSQKKYAEVVKRFLRAEPTGKIYRLYEKFSEEAAKTIIRFDD